MPDQVEGAEPLDVEADVEPDEVVESVEAAVDSPAEVVEGMPGPRLHEDSVRFIRQRLAALEEGRTEDADTIEEFISSEFGVTVVDRPVENLPQTFREKWGIPGSKLVVSIIRETREPIWRIPNEDGSTSGWETPLHLLPPDPVTGETLVGANAPEHLRPRLKESGPLPETVASAIRPWRG